MNKICVIVATLVLLVGCSAEQEKLSNADKHELHLKPSLESLVQGYKKRRNSNGLLEVQILLKSSYSTEIDYKIDWLDTDGFVLRNPLDEDYKRIRLVANKEYLLDKLSSDKRAVDFKIDIKSK